MSRESIATLAIRLLALYFAVHLISLIANLLYYPYSNAGVENSSFLLLASYGPYALFSVGLWFLAPFITKHIYRGLGNQKGSVTPNELERVGFGLVGLLLLTSAIPHAVLAVSYKWYSNDVISNSTWRVQDKALLTTSIVELLLGLILLFGPEIIQTGLYAGRKFLKQC